MVKDLHHLLSEESKGRKPSPLKSAFKYYGQDDLVFLGGGLPMSDYFPWEKIVAYSPAPPFTGAAGIAEKPSETGKSTVTELYKEQVEKFDVPLARSLQYGYTAGQPELLDFLKKHTEIIHHPPYPEWDTIVSIGNTESWDSTLRTFCNPGDTILVEEYTFSSAIETARALSVNFAPVHMDDKGLIPEELEKLLKNWDSSVKPFPKLLYSISTGQNPTGSSLSNERRKQIYDIACKYDFVIIEDEPYYFLQMGEYNKNVEAKDIPTPTHEEFLNSLVKSFLSMDVEGRVVRLDSCSKVLAPGTRLGWIVAQKDLLERYVRLHEVSIQTSSGFTQSLIAGLLGRWGQDGYIDWLIGLRKEYTIKRDFTTRCLEKYMPSLVKYDPPVAGMFFTVIIDAAKHPEFATKYDSDPIKVEDAVYHRALKAGCLMIPGSWFRSPNFEGSSSTFFFRGTYAAVDLKQLDIGLERFGKAIKEEFGVTN
ncbi:DEKNAAC103644 [Brettanomyces naardenensis]|uniref:aromatic-amino-acid transaminase n=1 Tax=Brettanomyces naardenensis TaxID=13370 RepID=A0A448YN41_BRENA|nr:DEKNAAC103644 [Brettanomyces naardenensis]